MFTDDELIRKKNTESLAEHLIGIAAYGIFGTNMQKFGAENGTLFVGHYALSDTMADLLVDCLGAFIMSVIGYFSIKYNKNWHEKLIFKRKVNQNK